MNKEQVITEVNQVMIEAFEMDTDLLKPESKIVDDLQLDSLDAIDMLVYLEDKIQVKVDVEQFRKAKTLGDIYNIVSEVISQSND